ncbi:hypothetical protein A2U01_0008303, partial [Trifolium medium]|nr:hypothetical protein [Trifolium medium]
TSPRIYSQLVTSDLGVDSGHFSSAPGKEFSVLLQASFKLFVDQVGESSTDLDSLYGILTKWNDLEVSVWDGTIDLLSSWLFIFMLLFLVPFFGELIEFTAGIFCSAFFFFGVTTLLRFLAAASKHLLAAAMSPLIVAT